MVLLPFTGVITVNEAIAGFADPDIALGRAGGGRTVEPLPYPFTMTIALAASSAFMAPISPINARVAPAGNDSGADAVRAGLPFTLIVMAMTALLLPRLLPL